MSTTPEEVMDEPPEEAEEYDLSVGDVMSDGYVAVPADTSIEAATDRFQEFAPDDSTQTTVYYTYVVDADDRLVGVASLREMLSAPDKEPISSIMKEEVVSFHETADAE